MKAPKMSRSATLQYIYSDIWDYLEELGAEEVAHYRSSFPRESDFNLVNYGSMRVYYFEIRDMYERAGCKWAKEEYKQRAAARRKGAELGDYKVTDSELWGIYRSDVGKVSRIYLEQAKKEG